MDRSNQCYMCGLMCLDTKFRRINKAFCGLTHLDAYERNVYNADRNFEKYGTGFAPECLEKVIYEVSGGDISIDCVPQQEQEIQNTSLKETQNFTTPNLEKKLFFPYGGGVEKNCELQQIRKFDTGATRDVEDRKLDFEGFLSPDVLFEVGQYMHKHRFQKDGSLRASDNWQKGMPKSSYLKSMLRHVFDVWRMMRHGWNSMQRPDGEAVTLTDALCGIFFNVQGLLHEILKEVK